MASLKTTSRLWGITFYAIIAVLLIFYFNTDLKILNLLEIQFTDNWNQFKEMVAPYSHERLVMNNNLDFLFLVLYSLLFYFSVKVMAQSVGFKLSKWIYLCCFLPGVFDLIENFSFLYFVNNLETEKNFKIYYLAVRIKWFLVIGFFLINLTIVFYYGLFLFGKYYNLIFGKSKSTGK